MSDEQLKEMTAQLMELLSDCHQPASNTNNWKLVDRINDNYQMLETINNSINLNT